MLPPIDIGSGIIELINFECSTGKVKKSIFLMIKDQNCCLKRNYNNLYRKHKLKISKVNRQMFVNELFRYLSK